MVDFLKKWYIVLSIIPGISMILWLFTVFYCMYKSELKKFLPMIIVECVVIAIAVYLIPQKLIECIYSLDLYKDVINFINISFTFFLFDLNLRRIIMKHEKNSL